METVRLTLPSDIYLPAEAVKGAAPSVQAFLVCIQKGSSVSEDHYVVDAQYHRIDQELHEILADYLRNTFGECVVSFIFVDLPGKAEVVSIPRDRDLFRAAAAVAVVKAACGWDENNPMIIKMNDSELAISLNRDDQSWIAVSASTQK